jgi:hypothetical protein
LGTLMEYFRNLYLIMRNKLVAISFALFLSVTAWSQTSDTNFVRTENSFSNQAIELTNKIEIYPNPAVEYVIVKINNSTLENTEIEMRSIIGNEIRVKVEKVNENEYKIPVKDFATGYYFVVVKDELVRFKKAYRFLKD